MKFLTTLNEGFTHYSVHGSDTASDDFYGKLCLDIAKCLEKILKRESNPYNTSGAVNVAMIIKEHLGPGFFNQSAEVKKVARMAKDQLQKEIDEMEAGPAFPERERHIKEHIALQKVLHDFAK